jgi:predicted ribonuclease toxin of YeeF-YezG toxin-antitoxin module
VSLFDLVPGAALWRLCGAVALAGGALWGVHLYNAHQQGIGAARVQALWDAAKDTANAEARAQELTWADGARKASDAYAKNANQSRAAAAAAGDELGRLRDTVAASAAQPASQNASAAIGIDGAGTFRDLFGECASALQKVAAEADRLEAKLIGLQGYVLATRPTEKAPD